MFTFIHAADIHLDSPLEGLAAYDGAPVDAMRQAGRRAFEQLVELALEEQAAFLLIAGDLYDGDWRDYNTGLYLMQQLARLREGGVRVFIVSGNHDAANQITKSLRHPENVTWFSPRKPETADLPECGAAVHGRSYPQRDVVDNLAADYPEALNDRYNIGLLHTCCGAAGGAHANYAPCSLDDLLAKEYQYWALGHVHRRQALCGDPPVHFPGNLQGRHVREAGPKGALRVKVSDAWEADVEFVALDAARWAEARVDVGQAEGLPNALDAVQGELRRCVEAADGRLLALRVVLTGRTPAHEVLHARPERLRNEIRALAADYGAGQVWIEKVRVETQPPETGRRAGEGALSDLTEAAAELLEQPAGHAVLAEALEPLRAKLPPELREGPGALECLGEAGLRRTVEEAAALLRNRLLGEEGPPS